MTPTEELIEQALAEAAGTECVTCSFQSECVVLVDLLRLRRPRIPVLFLDTGYHFAETCVYRDQLAAAWNLNLIRLQPALSTSEQESRFGILYNTQPDRCCALRKVEPLFAALENYGTWFAGLRREQSKSRAELKPADDFRLPSGTRLRKISPLADWSTRDVWQYMQGRAIPELPLYARGYTSIGCQPCTSLPLDPNDPRSGRWSGKKLECGIHLQG